MVKEIEHITDDQIMSRIRMLEDNVRYMRTEKAQVLHEMAQIKGQIEDNKEKIKNNKQLPYLVSNVVEIIDVEPEEEEEGANQEQTSQLTGKCAIIKTTTRQTIFLPVPGLVDIEELTPGELIGVNKDSFLILEKLPNEYDSRIKAMEIDEKPTEDYTDIGGLDKQIEELREAVVLPITHKDK